MKPFPARKFNCLNEKLWIFIENENIYIKTLRLSKILAADDPHEK